MFCVACDSWEVNVHNPSCPALGIQNGIGNYTYIGLFMYFPNRGSADVPKMIGLSRCSECFALVNGLDAQDHEDWHVTQHARWGEVQKRLARLLVKVRRKKG